MRQRKPRNLGTYRLGSGYYRVEAWSKLDADNYGDCTYATKRKEGLIRILWPHHGAELMDTVLHECLHATFNDMPEAHVRRHAEQLTVVVGNVLRQLLGVK